MKARSRGRREGRGRRRGWYTLRKSINSFHDKTIKKGIIGQREEQTSVDKPKHAKEHSTWRLDHSGNKVKDIRPIRITKENKPSHEKKRHGRIKGGKSKKAKRLRNQYPSGKNRYVSPATRIRKLGTRKHDSKGRKKGA